MVKQIGLPTLFITVAPYEWSFPYHVWIEDAMKKLLRSKLHLPVAETLHMAHVLAQTVVGLLTGANRRRCEDRMGKAWTRHLFSAKDGSGRPTVVNFFARLEFQDGKRKRYVGVHQAGQQFYHGRGTVHVHLLVWLQNVDVIKLEEIISATSPSAEENEAFRSIVEGSQRSYSGSGWPIFEGTSYYDAQSGLLRLKHLESDFCTYNNKGEPEGLRAYVKDILAALLCHVDVQASDGRGMLLRYVSGYVSKFSDSFVSEWLNDAASDYSVARRVLTDYHPLEPEMILQMALQWFPQVFAGGTMRQFVVPVPWARETLPEIVRLYMASDWRREDMSLAEYMRKATKTGKIQRHLKRRYKQAMLDRRGEDSDDREDLETWVAAAPTLGESLTASMYLSRYNDRYYGQWLLMNVPFRSLDDLWRPEADLVPDHLRFQALTMLLRPDHWRDPDTVQAELELEAFRKHHVQNVLSMLRANHRLVEQYLDGTYLKEDYVEPTAAPGQPLLLAPDQERIKRAIIDSAQQGMQERQSREDFWRGEDGNSKDERSHAAKFPEQEPHRPVIVVLGPAGSGKTTVVEQAFTEVNEKGGRVLIVAPTGKLAATYRSKHPHLDVDTIHGAFQVWKDENETLELMYPYDLVIVEEIGQLSRTVFERLIRLWLHAETLPTLVFLGDFFQLNGVDPSRATDSPYWNKRDLKKMPLYTMRRCKCDLLRQKLEILRTAKPNKQQLRFITRNHKAPERRHRTAYLMNEEPSLEDIGHILQETPKTIFLTIRRRPCGLLNDYAVQCLYGNEVPLAVLPIDPESNMDNYEGSCLVRGEPKMQPIYRGMRIVLTKNLHKDVGYVNGMSAEVLDIDRNAVVVRTAQRRIFSVYLWTSEEHWTFYPFRLGYASTLHKVQGATLEHITLWLDFANAPAAAYVALSRVQYDANWRYVGNPGVHHFTPARM